MAANVNLLDPGGDPLEQFNEIRNLLGNHNSDVVRQMMADKQVPFELLNRDVPSILATVPAAAVSASDVLDTPFFSMKGLHDLPPVEIRLNDVKMSGNVSKTAWEILFNSNSFEVDFDAWDTFAGDTTATQAQEPTGTLKPYVGWGDVLFRLLQTTHDSNVINPSEPSELVTLVSQLNYVLELFGFLLCIRSGSAENFYVMDIATGEEIIFGEGKESAMLPRRHIADGHELCLFGFATRVARQTYSETRGWTAMYRSLCDLLGIPDIARTETKYHPSAMALALLRGTDNNIRIIAAAVRGRCHLGQQEPHDAVNLWAATMQACHYSVTGRRNLSLVLSARVVWFIRLRANATNNQCTIEISDGYRVGSAGFFRVLIQFLLHVRQEPKMSMGALRLWDAALCQEREEGYDDDDEGKGNADEGEGNDNGGEGEGEGDDAVDEEDDAADATDDDKQKDEDSDASPAWKRRKRQSSGGVKGSVHVADHVRLQKQLSTVPDPPPILRDDATTIAWEEPKCVDKFGVVVPWLHQIGTRLEVLGTGRAGSVTRNLWQGESVAVKTFSLQRDDERLFFDVYKHEHKVLVSLRSLWGTHVPRLLFRKPWRTSPMLGLQLGERLDDDMSTWDPEDQKKAKETIARVSALGWVQRDIRGANFVRLRKGKSDWIAMIDFESVEKVKK